MEAYLQYMKTLRSEMNEVEDQAAKISVEEQMLVTTIQDLEKELEFVTNEKKRVKEDNDRFLKGKGEICSRILETRRKITSLESDSSTLNQTLDLMKKERVSLSAKLVEQSTYYSNTLEEIKNQLNEQQSWIIANNHRSCAREKSPATQLEDKSGHETDQMEGGCFTVSQGNSMESLMAKLDAATTEFNRMKSLRADLDLQSSEMQQSVELVKDKINNSKPEIKNMDIKMLEEELQALLSDKAVETEYLQSLQLQIMKMKEISHTVRCSCGEEYKVELGPRE